MITTTITTIIRTITTPRAVVCAARLVGEGQGWGSEVTLTLTPEALGTMTR